jgi:hypothetical protein
MQCGGHSRPLAGPAPLFEFISPEVYESPFTEGSSRRKAVARGGFMELIVVSRC